jgi:EAL and modified HD-GYP domain-containing signal transduction protein
MTLSLIKLINSAAFGLKNPVSSVSHAITMFGKKNLERWLMLLLYAQQGNENITEPLSPLFESASLRAQMMENIARMYSSTEKNNNLHEKAYFVGLVSMADTLFGVEMERILEEFHFDDEINSAILQESGVLGEMLCLIRAYERDDTEQVTKIISELKISPEKFSQAVKNSFSGVFWYSEL